jgi:hypothetical protein
MRLGKTALFCLGVVCGRYLWWSVYDFAEYDRMLLRRCSEVHLLSAWYMTTNYVARMYNAFIYT